MIFLSSFLRERRNDFNSQSTDPHPVLCRHTFGQQRALPTYRCSRGNQPGPASSSHYITRQTISQALHPAHGPGRPWGSPVLRWRLGRAGSTAVSVRILKGFYFVGVKKSPQRRRSRTPPLPTCNFCGFFYFITNTILRVLHSGQRGEAAARQQTLIGTTERSGSASPSRRWGGTRLVPILGGDPVAPLCYRHPAAARTHCLLSAAILSRQPLGTAACCSAAADSSCLCCFPLPSLWALPPRRSRFMLQKGRGERAGRVRGRR